MSRQDQGAATGTIPYEPGRCRCGHRSPLHRLNGGLRKACTASRCLCRAFAPIGKQPAVSSPPRTVDLAGVRQRYAELDAARQPDSGASTSVIRMLAEACADDVPALLAALTGEAL